jgi:DNA-binding NarL/FixJ family response regulator
MTTVVVADDQELVRSGLEMVLVARGVEVVGLAEDGRQAVDLVRRTRPDVVLMDIRMPVLDGIAATRELTTSGSPTRVLVLTTYDLDSYVYRALAAGAAGFLLKATPPDRLVAGIETVAAGEALLAPSLTRRLIEEHVRGPEPLVGVPPELAALTERELEVFTLVAQGLANDDIARRLVVSEATVKTHLNRLIAKLGNRNRVQLVVLAYETGLVRPGGQSSARSVLSNAANSASSPGLSSSRPATDISNVASDAPGAANQRK